ncbi:AAA family ATPase [Streptomyces sp. NPDC006463]|uniref:AAA family ATPase n=1 Tax=Streptomyces sp. NPDC006463 TaxID=3364746 RepID=UPI0036A99CD0
MSTPFSAEYRTERPQDTGAVTVQVDVQRARRRVAPQGIVDLRGRSDQDIELSYPSHAAVIVAGLPGSGKSTLLRAWSTAATVVDPRATRTAYEARMPVWLPYAVYRPWARLRHLQWTRSEIRRGQPLLIHDCGGRAWMRRWLAHTARRARRPLHMVVLDVGPQEALSGQHARRRLASRRAFETHQRGLTELLSRIEDDGLTARMGIRSLVLLDRGLRDRVTSVRFGPSQD